MSINLSELSIKPIEVSQTIPSYWYTEPSVLEFEFDSIFYTQWIYVGHRNQLLKNGNQLNIKIGNEPVLIIENDLGELKAFYNVCKHRGGPLCLRKGSKSVIQCQYHGWTYTSDGHLRGVPEFDRVELFDKKDFGLTPISVAEFQGLIFVSLAENPSKSFREFSAEIANDIAPIDLSKFSFIERVSYPVKCNWKIYIDNYLEGYHIPHVHPELNKLLDYRTYKTQVSKWHSLQHSNFKETESFYGTAADKAFYYFIYPNCMLNILPGRMQTNRVEPTGANSCIVHFDYFYDLEQYSANRIAQDKAYSESVQKEDEEICEQVQIGLGSKSYSQGRFSVKCEQGVYHFQSLIKQDFLKKLNVV